MKKEKQLSLSHFIYKGKFNLEAYLKYLFSQYQHDLNEIQEEPSRKID
ncbi:hypothetical protein QY95_02963 [Bacillus thermotolerans]|uniref:Uncharacterized protein n=1 Tax=Bacillus thermotolerans TaxID=1221996 RepID=A0A0F5HUH9_BACTR|nr:hypothetical protein QY95_02963 [Bacillus thermotolerans]